MEGKPAGTVYIGVALPNDKVYSHEYHFTGSRNEIRRKCVDQGLELILLEVKK
nr:CinA family protein [Lentilactobacillus kosonis]